MMCKFMIYDDFGVRLSIYGSPEELLDLFNRRHNDLVNKTPKSIYFLEQDD